MIKAILFDMDDTLLDINLEAYLVSYVAHMSRLMAEISSKPTYSFAYPHIKSYLAMANPGRLDNYTNDQIYVSTFKTVTGIPLDDPMIYQCIQAYQQEVFPTMNNPLIHAHANPGAHEALEEAKRLGMKTVLATNPTFSQTTVRSRMQWGQFSWKDFDYVTTRENSHRVKPCLRYYQETAEAIGLELEECLMVGNDPKRDITTDIQRLKTIYIGHGRPRRAFRVTKMDRLADELECIIDQANKTTLYV